MALVDVPCTLNAFPINVVSEHIDGKTLSFTIEPRKAQIDAKGCIRFFMLDWGDEEIGYLLHPIQKYASPQYDQFINAASWSLSFLASYGLSRVQGAIVSRGTANRNLSAARMEGIHLMNYVLNTTVGTSVVKSFADWVFPNEKQLGYHNIISDKLIWLKPLYIQK